MKSAVKVEKNKAYQYMTLIIDRPFKECYQPNVKNRKMFFEKLAQSEDGTVKQNGHTYEVIGSRFTIGGRKIYYLMRDGEDIPCAFIDIKNEYIDIQTYADQQ